MKITTRAARKALSVFLAVLMMVTTWAVAVPGAFAAEDSGSQVVDCSNGKHLWHTPVYVSNTNEYYEICKVCGEKQFTKAEFANYNEFYAVVVELNNLAQTENLIPRIEQKIADALAVADKLDKNYPADVTTKGGQFVKGNQEVIDRYVAELTAVVKEINDLMADDLATKPDFTAYEAALAVYKTKTLTIVVSQEDKNAVAEAVRVVEAIKAKENAAAKNNATIEAKTAIIAAVNSKYEYCVANGHMEVVIEGREPACLVVGLTDGKKCMVCDAITVDHEEIPALIHTDSEGDGVCDVCGKSGLYDGCSCMCHNDSLSWRLIYMIVNFIWRTFGMKQVCTCGVAHY